MLKYITRGNSDPQGKPRVYITGYPDDVEKYLNHIAELVFKHENCVIYYNTKGEVCNPEELDQMQLVVIVVTNKFLYEENYAYKAEFKYAMDNRIPVLPILEEDCEMDKLNEMLKDLQCLDPNSTDATAVSFDVKLSKFLKSVLIGDELAEQIRNAFDAYIFLSYRKKDRKYANELMRLIHSNDFATDIAIWFDEYLVPGENFNSAIKTALDKSDLFVLAVTPNLVNESNYVQMIEYPMAVVENKKILPVEMVQTDKTMLNEQYENISECLDASDRHVFSKGLFDALGNIAKRERNDDPKHNFFIGLAYLGGIDVERNGEKAEQLIVCAAKGGLVEAMKKLVYMYHNGDGVKVDYPKSIMWQHEVVNRMGEVYKQNKCTENALSWLNEMVELGEMYGLVYDNQSRLDIYYNVNNTVEYIIREIPKSYIIMRFQIEALHGLADCYQKLGNNEAYMECEQKAFYYSEYCLEHTHSAEGLKLARQDYRVAAAALSFAYQNFYDYENALKYSKLATQFEESEAASGQEMEQRRMEGYNLIELGNSYRGNGDLTNAVQCMKKAYTIFSQLYDEFPTSPNLKSKGHCGLEYGRVLLTHNQLEAAERLYRESLDIFVEMVQNEKNYEIMRFLMEAYSKNLYFAIQRQDVEYGMRIAGEYMEAAAFLKKSATNAQARKDIARCYEGVAQLYSLCGKMYDAICLQLRGRDIYVEHYQADETFYPALDLAESDQKLWKHLIKNKEYDKVPQFCWECIDLLEKHGEGRQYSNSLIYDAYITLGELYTELYELELALNTYKAGFHYFKSLEENGTGKICILYQAKLMPSISALFLRMDNIEAAVKGYENTIIIAEKIKDLEIGRYYMALGSLNLGILLSGVQSREYLLSASHICEELMAEVPENEEYRAMHAEALKRLLEK